MVYLRKKSKKGGNRPLVPTTMPTGSLDGLSYRMGDTLDTLRGRSEVRSGDGEASEISDYKRELKLAVEANEDMNNKDLESSLWNSVVTLTNEESEKHFHLFRGGILSLIKNDKTLI